MSHLIYGKPSLVEMQKIALMDISHILQNILSMRVYRPILLKFACTFSYIHRTLHILNNFCFIFWGSSVRLLIYTCDIILVFHAPFTQIRILTVHKFCLWIYISILINHKIKKNDASNASYISNQLYQQSWSVDLKFQIEM